MRRSTANGRQPTRRDGLSAAHASQCEGVVSPLDSLYRLLHNGPSESRRGFMGLPQSKLSLSECLAWEDTEAERREFYRGEVRLESTRVFDAL